MDKSVLIADCHYLVTRRWHTGDTTWQSVTATADCHYLVTRRWHSGDTTWQSVTACADCHYLVTPHDSQWQRVPTVTILWQGCDTRVTLHDSQWQRLPTVTILWQGGDNWWHYWHSANCHCRVTTRWQLVTLLTVCAGRLPTDYIGVHNQNALTRMADAVFFCERLAAMADRYSIHRKSLGWTANSSFVFSLTAQFITAIMAQVSVATLP